MNAQREVSAEEAADMFVALAASAQGAPIGLAGRHLIGRLCGLLGSRVLWLGHGMPETDRGLRLPAVWCWSPSGGPDTIELVVAQEGRKYSLDVVDGEVRLTWRAELEMTGRAQDLILYLLYWAPSRPGMRGEIIARLEAMVAERGHEVLQPLLFHGSAQIRQVGFRLLGRTVSASDAARAGTRKIR